MSERYKGIVFSADESAFRQFLDEFPPGLALRMARLAPDILGIYQFEFDRGSLAYFEELERFAQRLSKKFGPALTVFYDNQCGVRVAILFADGLALREFGEADEIWVPYNDDGSLNLNGPRFAGDQVPMDIECDCLQGAIDVGLEVAGWSELKSENLKDAFAYDEYGCLAEWPARLA